MAGGGVRSRVIEGRGDEWVSASASFDTPRRSTARSRPCDAQTGVPAARVGHDGRMRRRLAMIVSFVLCATALAVIVPTAGSATDTGDGVRAKALAWAVKQVGVREVGTSNCSPTIDRWERAMGLRLPPCRVWCGAFVHQAYLQAGVRLSRRLIDPHRSFADAIAGRRHLRKIAIPTSARATSSSTSSAAACARRISRSPAPRRRTAYSTRSRATSTTRCAWNRAARSTSCSLRASRDSGRSARPRALSPSRSSPACPGPGAPRPAP